MILGTATDPVYFLDAEELASVIDAIRDGEICRQGLAKEYQEDYGSVEKLFVLNDPDWAMDFAPGGELVQILLLSG